MKKILISLLLIHYNTFSQSIIIKNCSENEIVSNVIVFDVNDKIIGISNEDGILNINGGIKEIKIYHPKYGTKNFHIDDIICLDEEILQEISIESGEKVKKELIEILNNSFNKAKEIKELYFNVDNKVFTNNELLESYNGIIKSTYKKNSIKNTFYNSEINISSKTKQFNNYSLVEAFKFVDYYLPKYTLFNTAKEFNNLLNRIEKTKINKENNLYFVYLDDNNYDDYIVFEKESDGSSLLKRYTNSTIKWAITKDKKNRKLVNSYTDIFFNFSDINHFQKIQITENFIIENKNVNFTFKSNSYKINKEVLKDEKSTIGFLLMYMKKYTSIK